MYETRQYKKGLKLAEGILKKFPEHGGKLKLNNVQEQRALTLPSL